MNIICFFPPKILFQDSGCFHHIKAIKKQQRKYFTKVAENIPLESSITVVRALAPFSTGMGRDSILISSYSRAMEENSS